MKDEEDSLDTTVTSRYCTVLYCTVLDTVTSREEDGAQSAVPDWLEAELKEAETEDKLNR